MELNVAEAVLRKPASLAIKLISMYGDAAEAIVYRTLSGRAKDVMLDALKNRRIQLYNLRGY